ncbi:sulfotransferase [Rhodobacteraceae bacterium]|jgi:hypothetical protein|nr:sulfotransferase [Paracoccaceae bacterium]
MSTPNLFLIAAPRAGSTQLAYWMDSHPDISLSRVKEPNYFSAHEFKPDYVRSSHLNDVNPTQYVKSGCARRAQFAVFRSCADYEALFATSCSRWRFEASTSYLACPEAPVKLQVYAPQARIILLTRNPLERSLSHYKLARRTGRVAHSLRQALLEEQSGITDLAARFLLRPSRQWPGCARIKALFDPGQILSIEFEKMIVSPRACLNDIAAFLNVDPRGFDLSVQVRNASAAVRFDRLNRLLEVRGFKTILRRHLPFRIKAMLKPIWFDTGCTMDISAGDRFRIASALDIECGC